MKDKGLDINEQKSAADLLKLHGKLMDTLNLSGERQNEIAKKIADGYIKTNKELDDIIDKYLVLEAKAGGYRDAHIEAEQVIADISKNLEKTAEQNIKNLEAQAQYNDLIPDQADHIKTQLKNNKGLLATIKGIAGEQQLFTKLQEDAQNAGTNAIPTMDALANAAADITDARQTQLENEEGLNHEGLQSIDIEGAREKYLIAQKQFQRDKSKMSDEEIMTAQANLDILNDSVLSLEAYSNKVETVKNKADALGGAFMDAFGTMRGEIEKLPGGTFLTKAMGLDKLQDTLGKAIGPAMQTALTDGPAAGLQSLKQYPGLAQAFNMSMTAATGGLILLAGILIGAFATFNKMYKDAKKLSEETGITVGQAKQLNKEARQAQMRFSNQLATFEDITAVQKEMINHFGTMASVNTEIAAKVADMGRAFGYGAEQAGKTHVALMEMGASQQEALDLQAETTKKALIAGVNVAAVQKDISDNAAEALKYLGGSPEALADAAVAAAELGVNLKTMVNIADGLLNIEDSLQKQFRAQALTGKMINFDTARRLALEGDIEGATKAVLAQMGSVAEFEAMSVVQKKAMADAAGMSVEELTKSMHVQEKLGDLTDDQKAAMANMNISAAQLKKMSAAELKDRLAQQQSLDKSKASFEKLKNTLMTALMPLAESFSAIFEALAPAIEVLGPILKLAFLPVTVIGEGIRVIVDGLTHMKNLITGNTEGMTTMQKIFGAILTIITAMGTAYYAYIGYQKLSAMWNKKSLKDEVKKAGGTIAWMWGKVTGAFASLGPWAIPAGIAAAVGIASLAYGAFTKAKSAGDVSIDPNGGPVVGSPQEGTLYQGTKNDGVSMSPDHGSSGGAGGGGGGTSGDPDKLTPSDIKTQTDALISVLQEIAQGVMNPPPVVIGEQQSSDIGNTVSALKSFL